MMFSFLVTRTGMIACRELTLAARIASSGGRSFVYRQFEGFASTKQNQETTKKHRSRDVFCCLVTRTGIEPMLQP